VSPAKPDSPDGRTNKQRGALYEAAFGYYATRAGCEVFTSNADHSVVDAIVISEMGQVYRVQIKGTEGEKVVTVKTTKGAKGKVLSESEYDVLAVYAAAYDLWYLIPSHMVNKRRTLKIYPMFPNSKGQYEIYRGNWNVFK